MKLSVVIPAYNEEGCLPDTLLSLEATLTQAQIEHEILVVNDHSSDGTSSVLEKISSELFSIHYVDNQRASGFGNAIHYGLDKATGDYLAIYMADGSDNPNDLVRFFREAERKKVDCVFGSRFMKESVVVDYPWPKLVLNRLVNFGIRVLFQIRYNDVSNAFKLYRREVIEGVRPILSPHFNLTVELPLKAIVRGYSYSVLPNSWHNRKEGVSKLKIKEMGSRYLFIILYCLLEKWLSRGDYYRGEEINTRGNALRLPEPDLTR